METFLRDLRYAFRMLLRTPGVSAIAVLALALGIGAISAIFSVVYAALLRPLPVRDAGRLVSLQAFNPRMNIPPITPSYSSYGGWKKLAVSFEGMAASWAGTAEVSVDRNSEKVPYCRVSATFLPLLGVQPGMGRAFSEDEDRPGAPRVAMLSDDFWQRRFGRDRAAVGKTFRLDGEVYTVLGVMPRGFRIDGKPADVYAPIAQDPADRKRYLAVATYARLKPGVTAAQAQQELDVVARGLGRRSGG